MAGPAEPEDEGETVETAPEAGPVTVTLSKPVMIGGEDVTELAFREPTGKDIREIGMPLKIYGDESFEVITATIFKYTVRLAGVPGNQVDRMPPEDFAACLNAVMGFFGGARPT